MRSGSTLLRYLLGSHERLACPPESKFIGGLDAFLRYPQVASALRSFGLSHADLLRQLRTLTENIFGECLRSTGKPRWVDKTPGYHRFLSLIDAMFEGEVQYIVIVRHPLDTIFSLEAFCERYPKLIESDPDAARFHQLYGRHPLAWAKYWEEVYEAGDSLRSAIPERAYVVRYEDLVAAPAELTGQAVSFLGEDPALLHIEDALQNTRQPGFQDDKIRRTTSVHTDSVRCSMTWPENQRNELWAVVEQTARKFGYENY